MVVTRSPGDRFKSVPSISKSVPGLLIAICLSIGSAVAAVLPEDRADALYHSYDGGGVQVTGPSLLIRKGDGKSVSVSGNYYVDTISSASVDVISQGSPYSEERTQLSGSIDYLHANTSMSMGITSSEESDYSANTVSFGLSQSLLGELTAVSMGYSVSADEVRQNGLASFEEDLDRQNFRLSVSQVLSKHAAMTVDFENITEEGFLNNPYRSVRYLDPTTTLGYSFQPEVYPRTRTSNTVATRLKYYLPWRAALQLGYRFSADDWDIQSHSFELGYKHPYGPQWTFETDYRYYTQSQADFYSDLYPFKDAQNFLARDKELSRFKDHSIGFGARYEFDNLGNMGVTRSTVNLKYNHFWFQYDNYRDINPGGAVGSEPLYEFDADVIQLFLSVWY